MRAAILLLLTAAAPALLRGQAAVSGKVTDETGNAVPAAKVEVRSGDDKPLAVLTDIAGAFQLNLPSPGHYRIRAVCQGYFVFDGAADFAEGDNQLNLTLHHQRDFYQTVEVDYSPPQIDPQQPAEQKVLTNIEILEVPYPASQDVRNAMPMLPGVLQDASGQLHFNGGATDQTNFKLDGFNVTDPVTGRFESRLNIDTVRTIDVESSRFSAEHGRGSAGSVDLKTQMGDDHWRFGATNFVPGASAQEGFHINKWTPRLSLSGPLAKGRAWFHNGFDAFYDVDTIPELPPGANRSRALSGSNHTRIQANLTPGNILTASFLYNTAEDRRRGLTFLDPAETTIDRNLRSYFTSIRDQFYLPGGLIFELGFADSRNVIREQPQGDETFEISPEGRSGNFFQNLTRHAYRQEWLAKTYLPTFEYAGTHQFQFGLNLQRVDFEQNAIRSEYRVLRFDRTLSRLVRFAGNGFYDRANFEATQYLQDRWIPHEGLLIEAGLRLDWNEVVRDVVYSPRVSAAWSPKWAGGSKLSAGYGIFHDALSLGTISRHMDQTAVSTFFAPDGSVSRGPIETAFFVNDRELRIPRYRMLSLSAERELPLGMNGRITYIRKVGRGGLSFFNDLEPAISLLRLRNWRNDRYDSLELTVRKTIGRFEWMGSYTRSSARSDAVLDYSLENPMFAPQGPGPFPWDAPDRFLTWGWAPVPKRLLSRWLEPLLRHTTVAYLAEFRTGFPFSIVDDENLLVGEPNSRRLPSYFNINLHFERRFKFMHYQWAWRFGINNLTNSGNPNVVNNNIDSPAFLAYGRGQQRAVNVRLRFLGRR